MNRPPAEPPRIAQLETCAPAFAEAVKSVLAAMYGAGWYGFVFESMRTDERQRWLYGFGREWDDGRGNVTNVPSAKTGWHFYGLAADIVQDDKTPWNAPPAFWRTLGDAAEAHGLKWGGRWKRVDLPHVQWGKCRVSPSPRARMLYETGGLHAVWQEVGAL